MRLQRTVSRCLVVALIALAATAGTARADDETDTPWPRQSTTFYLGGGAQYLGHESIGGPALAVEHALGRGRWQGVADVAVQWFPGDDDHADGIGLRFGAGARWLARSFQPDSSAAIEMIMNVGPGVEHLELADGRITRPDLSFGWGWQVRALGDRRWTFRIGFRLELAPAIARREVDRVVCKGRCTSAPSSSPIDEGFKTMLGFSW